MKWNIPHSHYSKYNTRNNKYIKKRQIQPTAKPLMLNYRNPQNIVMIVE